MDEVCGFIAVFVHHAIVSARCHVCAQHRPDADQAQIQSQPVCLVTFFIGVAHGYLQQKIESSEWLGATSPGYLLFSSWILVSDVYVPLFVCPCMA